MPIRKEIPVKADRMFEHYLYRVGLNKKSIPLGQYIEMKRSFFAALASMIVIFKEDFQEGELFKVLDDMEDDLREFWNKQQ